MKWKLLISEWFDEVRAWRLEFQAALNTGNLDLISSYYTDDATIMKPNARNYYGPEGIAKLYCFFKKNIDCY